MTPPDLDIDAIERELNTAYDTDDTYDAVDNIYGWAETYGRALIAAHRRLSEENERLRAGWSPICDGCHKPLTGPGSLLFGPPNADGFCKKTHICTACAAPTADPAPALAADNTLTHPESLSALPSLHGAEGKTDRAPASDGKDDHELRVVCEGPDAGRAGQVSMASGNVSSEADLRSVTHPEKRCFTYCGPERCDCGASGGLQEALEESRREGLAVPREGVSREVILNTINEWFSGEMTGLGLPRDEMFLVPTRRGRASLADAILSAIKAAGG